jgi:flagellar biosynthesis component FlhA
MRCVYSETSCFSILGNGLDLNKLCKTPTIPHFPFRNSFFVRNTLTEKKNKNKKKKEEEKGEEEEEEKKKKKKKKAMSVCNLT